MIQDYQNKYLPISLCILIYIYYENSRLIKYECDSTNVQNNAMTEKIKNCAIIFVTEFINLTIIVVICWGKNIIYCLAVYINIVLK